MSGQGIAEGFIDQGRYTPNNLIAGEFPRITRYVTVTGNTVLSAGAVLGKITADSRYQLSAAASTDGSQTPDAILAEAVDARSGDVQAPVYFSGEFNRLALQLGTGYTVAAIESLLRLRSIFLRDNVPA